MILSTLAGLLLSGGATVSLPMEATARGTEIELGEIATIEGADADVVERLRALELGYAPAPGYSRLLLQERIAQRVASKLPGIEVRYAGQVACRVRPAVQPLAEIVLVRAAREALEQHFGQQDASFVLSEPVSAVAVPAGTREPVLRARVGNTQAAELRSGSLSVPVEILIDDAVYRTVWTRWTAQVWRTVPVLVRPVTAGTALTAGLFERRRVPLEGDSLAQPLVPQAMLGGIAVRDLPAGAVVSAHDVHRPTAITAGTSIFLRVRKRGIEARVPALALSSGSVGGRVRVRTYDSEQELVATVVSRELVEIDLGY